MLSSTSCMEKTREDQEEPQNKLTKKYQDTSQEYQEEQIWGWRLGNFYVLRLLSYLLSRGKGGQGSDSSYSTPYPMPACLASRSKGKNAPNGVWRKTRRLDITCFVWETRYGGQPTLGPCGKPGQDCRIKNRQSGWSDGFIRRQWGKLAEMLNTVSCGQIHAKAYLPLSIASNLPAVFPTSPLQPPIGPTTWIRADLLRKQHSVPG